MSAAQAWPISEQSLPKLLDTWRQWNLTSTLADAAVGQEAAGQPEKAAVLASWLDCETRVDPLDALAANHRLAGLLTGWQWLAIHAARTGGGSWEQIGEAMETAAGPGRLPGQDRKRRAVHPGLLNRRRIGQVPGHARRPRTVGPTRPGQRR